MPSQAPNEREGEVLSRYGYLLKPIRDLFKNWEIDIAAELEEYLQETEQIKISFDGGQTVMNFAEAALLIQGSACIYSKKVEYLYTLVYQTLDLIASKRQLQQASSVDEQGKDKDVSCHEQQEEEFLQLDDIKEAKNIDLQENISHSEASQLIPRTPVTLITFDDSKKGSALLSHTGEVLGNRNDFKMNTCTVHLGSGALLLDVSNLQLVQNEAFHRFVTPRCENNYTQEELAKNDSQSNGVEGDCNGFDEGPQEDGGFDSYGDGMDCDDDPPGSPCAPTVPDVESERSPHGRNLRERIPDTGVVNVQEKELTDPWQTLDPHDPTGGLEKIFKKGRPFRIPESISEGKLSAKKRKRKSQELSTEKGKVLAPIAEFCRLAYHSHVTKLPKNPHKTLTCHQFEYIYWVEFRRRQNLERKNRKSRVLRSEGFVKLECLAADLDKNNNDAPLEDLDYDEGGHDDFDCDDDEVVDDINSNLNDRTLSGEGLQPMALEESDDLVVSSYEELVRKYVQGFLIQAQQYVQETELSRRVKEWERKVVPKLEDEDTHQPYDIHKYGEHVLASFTDKPMKSFEDVVISKANNYNVEICSMDSNHLEMDGMQLRLLHRTPAHEAISQYRAPSILT